MAFDMNDLKKRMDGALHTFQEEMKGLRTGRASASMLDTVQVEAYGGMMPLNQLASVSVPESRMLVVQVWDRAMAAAVEKAIRIAGLGLNPAAEGQVIRVPTPELSGERRKELVKVAQKYGEQQRVAIRNIRRDGMDDLKKMEKDGGISKDEIAGKSEEVQKVTDSYIKKVDEILVAKEKDIMQI
jgi:ribosome recycling factor